MNFGNDWAFDPKGLLQTACARLGRRTPSYVQVQSENASFSFKAEVYSGTHRLGIGYGDRKKEAEKAAAQDALISMGIGSMGDVSSHGAPRAKKRTSRKNRRAAAHKRKSERGSLRGRQFEQTVIGYLQELQDAGTIEAFVYHEPRSAADLSGKDFTVTKDGTNISFGVTTSETRFHHFKQLHPSVKLFYFPHNTKPETVKARVLELFRK